MTYEESGGRDQREAIPKLRVETRATRKARKYVGDGNREEPSEAPSGKSTGAQAPYAKRRGSSKYPWPAAAALV